MVNAKRKGSAWEREAVKILNNAFGERFKRVPGSGALGTMLHESILVSDVKGKFNFLPRPIRIECKVGYGGSKQMTIKKEWLDKVKEEADSAYSFSMLMGKFSGAREGTKHFVVIDLNTFIDIMKIAEKQKAILDEVYDGKEN